MPAVKTGACEARGTTKQLASWTTIDVGFELLVGPLAIDDEAVYWKELDPKRDHGADVRIRRVVRAGDRPATTLFETKSSDPLEAPPPPDYLAMGDGEVLYASRGAIHAVATSTGAVRKVIDGYFIHDLVVRDGTAYFRFEEPAKDSRFGIAKVPVSGGAARVLVPLRAGHARPRQFAVDGDALYWVDLEGEVHRLRHAGGAPLLLAKPRTARAETMIAIDATHVYVAQRIPLKGSSVVRVPREGGPVEEVALDQPAISALAVGPEHVVIGTNEGPRRLRRIAKASKAIEDLACVDTEPVSIAVAGGDVFSVQRPDPQRGKPGTVLKVTAN